MRLKVLNWLHRRNTSGFKVIFVDVDGVLNNDENLHDDVALNDRLISNLAMLAINTNAKIVISSAWRCVPSSFRKLWEAIQKRGITIYGMTRAGVPEEMFKGTKWEKVERYEKYNWDEELRYDRGAEIAAYLLEHPYINSFVILDDEVEDIKDYFPDNYIQTKFKDGLTRQDVNAAYIKLMR